MVGQDSADRRLAPCIRHSCRMNSLLIPPIPSIPPIRLSLLTFIPSHPCQTHATALRELLRQPRVMGMATAPIIGNVTALVKLMDSLARIFSLFIFIFYTLYFLMYILLEYLFIICLLIALMEKIYCNTCANGFTFPQCDCMFIFFFSDILNFQFLQLD